MLKKELFFIIIICLLLNTFQKEIKKIFEPIKLKNLNLKNRIFRGSMPDDGFFQNGHITEEAYKYYEQLSKEGTSLIYTGAAAVSISSNHEKIGIFRIDKDEYIEDYKKLSDVIHKNNVPVILDLIHPGILKDKNGEEKVYGASKVRHPNLNVNNKELTKEDILKIEDEFEKGAIRAKKANFDGIELHCAHLTLLSQFLSPAFNKRNDEYGGSDENRARIVIEIIQRIRKAVGNNFIISVKLNCNDGVERGITIVQFLNICKLIEKAGADIIQVSGNFLNRPKNNIPYFLSETKNVSDIVNIPIVLIGGIRDIETMEKILNESKIEFFGFGRPLICEPDLVKRWENGERSKSKCIECNGCLKTFSHKCVVNKNK